MALADKITCPAGQWTFVSNGKANVTIQAITSGDLRFHVGAVAPLISTMDFVRDRTFSLLPLSGDVNVYVMPVSLTASADVDDGRREYNVAAGVEWINGEELLGRTKIRLTDAEALYERAIGLISLANPG